MIWFTRFKLVLLDRHEAMLLKTQKTFHAHPRLGGVESALPTGHALANDLGVLIDPYLEVVLLSGSNMSFSGVSQVTHSIPRFDRKKHDPHGFWKPLWSPKS